MSIETVPEAKVSIVIPTLNAVEALPVAIRSLRPVRYERAFKIEIIIADGGSTDSTIDVAEDLGIHVVRCPAGRGTQLRAGAEMANGDYLLFLHADTCLAEKWVHAVDEFMHSSHRETCAAYFRYVLDDTAPDARRLEKIVAWRCRHFGLPYGDQGLFISKSLYTQVGGYRPIPLMEDVDLVRRIGRRQLIPLQVDAVTSAARYRRDGYRMRSLRNLICLSLYGLGAPLKFVKHLYG